MVVGLFYFIVNIFMFMIGQIINKAYVFHLSNKGHQKKRNANNFVWFLFCVQTNKHIIVMNKRNARVIFIFRAFWIIYWKKSPLTRVAFESCLFMHLIWLPGNIHIDQPLRRNCGFRRQTTPKCYREHNDNYRSSWLPPNKDNFQ